MNYGLVTLTMVFTENLNASDSGICIDGLDRAQALSLGSISRAVGWSPREVGMPGCPARRFVARSSAHDVDIRCRSEGPVADVGSEGGGEGDWNEQRHRFDRHILLEETGETAHCAWCVVCCSWLARVIHLLSSWLCDRSLRFDCRMQNGLHPGLKYLNQSNSRPPALGSWHRLDRNVQ
jgi:hypothetical protein